MSNRSTTHKKPLLKLVHRGGMVETYDRPITAAEIMNKYPRHCVTRPDVFKYPWLVVRPQSVLQPGDVFYVVPYNTIRRLMQSKQCPEQPAYPEEAAGSGLDERTSSKFSDEARPNPRERQKIDFPGWLFVKDEIQSCSYNEPSVEALPSHQLVRRYSPDGDRRAENRKLEKNGPGDLRSVDPYDHRSGVMRPKKQLPQQFLGGRLSESMGSKGHGDGLEFPDRQHHDRERHCNSVEQPEDPCGSSSAEITEIHQLRKGLTLNCSQCKAERDTRRRIHAVTNSKKHSPDQFIEARSAGDFTFQRTNEDPKDIEESSPDMTPFLCVPKGLARPNARRSTESYKPGERGRCNSALKYPLNVTDPSKESAPRDLNNDRLINNGSHSSHQRNAYKRNEYTADGSKDRNLVLVTHGTDLCDSQGDSAEPKPCTMKSCIKKSGLRLLDRKVKFNYPGENEKKLIVEVFEYQLSDSPSSCLSTF